MHLKILLPTIISVSPLCGNRTWLRFSVVEIISEILMSDELVSPQIYFLCCFV